MKQDPEQHEENDPHPKGAYDLDGSKFAILGCDCRHCVQESIDRINRKHFRTRFQ